MHPTGRAHAWPGLLRRRALAAVALAAMLAAAGATAEARAAAQPQVAFAVGSAPMTVAQRIAAQHWGTVPCNGQVSITWNRLDPDINATSTWDNPRSAYGDPAENTDCHVEFNVRVPFDWPMFCTVLVHEFGHLTGHPHSRNPRSVMTPVYDGPLPACAATAQPGQTQASAETAPAPRHKAPRRVRAHPARAGSARRRVRVHRRHGRHHRRHRAAG